MWIYNTRTQFQKVILYTKLFVLKIYNIQDKSESKYIIYFMVFLNLVPLWQKFIQCLKTCTNNRLFRSRMEKYIFVITFFTYFFLYTFNDIFPCLRKRVLQKMKHKAFHIFCKIDDPQKIALKSFCKTSMLLHFYLLGKISR